MTKKVLLLFVMCFPLIVFCQTQEELDAKKQRIQDAMKANPDRAAEYQKMLNDLNNVKPGEGRPAPSSRPASDPRGGAGAPSGNAAGGGRGAAGKAVVIDGVTYTHDSLPGPLYVTLEWRVDPTGKKPSHAMLDANDTKAVTSLYGDAKSKNLQSQLNNAKSANEALSIMGTARFFVKHQWNDTSDGWQRSSYMLERIVPVKF